jgi:hypothetical protein
MIDLTILLREITDLGKTEVGRITVSVLVTWVAARCISMLQGRARVRCANDDEVARQRSNFVVAKNLILLIAVGTLGAIWASKIAGAALSVAAVAGAILLIAKDFLVNLLGTAILAISRPYRVGDFIEINGISGCVVDTSMLNTTVADTPHGNLVTGSTVTFPHVLLLSVPVRNLTATGSYVVKLLSISVTHERAAHMEPLLLKAAVDTCGGWVESASAHFRMIESRELLDLPSGSPKVIMDLSSHHHAVLTLRYACKAQDRITVEQLILRRYLELRDELLGSETTVTAPGAKHVRVRGTARSRRSTP